MNSAAGRQGIDSALDVAIALSCAVFIAVLLLSGYFERDVLTLHLFQSVIYVAVGLTSAIVVTVYFPGHHRNGLAPIHSPPEKTHRDVTKSRVG